MRLKVKIFYSELLVDITRHIIVNLRKTLRQCLRVVAKKPNPAFF